MFKLSKSAINKADIVSLSANGGNIRVEDNYLIVDDGQFECSYLLGSLESSPLEREEKAHEIGRSIRISKELIDLACYTLI